MKTNDIIKVLKNNASQPPRLVGAFFICGDGVESPVTAEIAALIVSIHYGADSEIFRSYPHCDGATLSLETNHCLKFVEARIADSLNTRPTHAEIEQAVDDWMTERSPADPGEIELAKVWLRLNREKIKKCEGCDGLCGEPCALTAEQHWAALCQPKKRPSGEAPWPDRPTAYGGYGATNQG